MSDIIFWKPCKNPCAPDVNIVQEEIQTIYLEEVHASAVAEEKW